MEAMTYEMDGVKIEIKPSSSGIATMWDKEVLIYVLSLMVQHIGRTGGSTERLHLQCTRLLPGDRRRTPIEA
ncbi:replication initiator protein A [Sphingomonas sp. LR55]|uniref:replication initiator protein A n=1 Tax=Sphingomonas sp. LR55 TaxID=3050231 RepID=UPI002FDF1C03